MAGAPAGYGMPPSVAPAPLGEQAPLHPSSQPPQAYPRYNQEGDYHDRPRSSPPPSHRRRTPSPRGYYDSRGYNSRDYGRSEHGGSYGHGYGHPSSYDRGYDRYDRGYDRGRDSYDSRDYERSRGGRGYDRHERDRDRGYDRDYSGGHHRGNSHGGYGSRARSPQRRSRAVNRGSEQDRLASKTLYVGNIPYSFVEKDVDDLFNKFGTIVKVTVVLDQYTGRNKGFAFVEFEVRKDAEEAMEKYNGFDVDGRRLKLDWDIGLGKKDIKPTRSSTQTTNTTENSTAESTPLPHDQSSEVNSPMAVTAPAEGSAMVNENTPQTCTAPSEESPLAQGEKLSSPVETSESATAQPEVLAQQETASVAPIEQATEPTD
ncbi:hypothetical protein BGW38_000202 [Lunasporangiospora selenospora]|uniref:RRM domain-containing protein n=1 Tax=Lunasporangiospora selenospora TaxID=979761 RepID=A0A9P6G2G6_9FUNG|nr:hypothetical protein BGW38_000202 [Lunasporangiospora selenospora]